MTINLTRFYKIVNPSRTLDLNHPEDRPYYIDFSPVRGGNIIQDLERTITRLSPDEPTCQLFTGHIGCGKSTELLRLKNNLEQQDFHVVYFESSEDLVMADIDVTDILLAIAAKVSLSLEQAGIKLEAKNSQNLFLNIPAKLKENLDLSDFSFGVGIAKITGKIKNSTQLRSQLRQYLEPRTDTLLTLINQELLQPAIKILKQEGKAGLVIIIDNLDRVDNSRKHSDRFAARRDRTQPEYLFIDRGEQLKQLNCHLVYTIPLALMFSKELERLKNRFRVNPKLLSMVRFQLRDGNEDPEGMNLLRQMVLARAFPQLKPEERIQQIEQLFDSPETLDRLCKISGGHVRGLAIILYSCLQQQDPPFSRDCLENIIKEQRDSLARVVDEEEWQLLKQVVFTGQVRGQEEYQALLRQMLVFEYRDREGGWFQVNPILAEAKELKDVDGIILAALEKLVKKYEDYLAKEDFSKVWETANQAYQMLENMADNLDEDRDRELYQRVIALASYWKLNRDLYRSRSESAWK